MSLITGRLISFMCLRSSLMAISSFSISNSIFSYAWQASWTVFEKTRWFPRYKIQVSDQEKNRKIRVVQSALQSFIVLITSTIIALLYNLYFLWFFFEFVNHLNIVKGCFFSILAQQQSIRQLHEMCLYQLFYIKTFDHSELFYIQQ